MVEILGINAEKEMLRRAYAHRADMLRLAEEFAETLAAHWVEPMMRGMATLIEFDEPAIEPPAPIIGGLRESGPE